MKNIKKIIASLLLAVTFLFVHPAVTLAGENPPANPEEIQLDPGKGFEGVTGFNISGLIQTAIKFVLITAAILFFFTLIFGGIRWILAGGDKAGVESARKIIVNALIGLAVVLSAWAITALIQEIFNVKILSPTIPTLGPGN